MTIFQISMQPNITISFKISMAGLIILLSGCSQYQQFAVIKHPGSYELTHLGGTQIDGENVRITRAHDKIFYSYANILGPTFFSIYLLEHTQILKGETVLDIGTGSGVQAIYAAEKARSVLATDIDPLALKNTQLNAQRLGVANKISTRESDLFSALKTDEKFDVIIASIPYAWDDKTQELWALQERFFNNVINHLNPDGRIYFLTGWLKNLSRTQAFIKQNNLKIVQLNMGYSPEENLEPVVYTIQFQFFVSKQIGNRKNVTTGLRDAD